MFEFVFPPSEIVELSLAYAFAFELGIWRDDDPNFFSDVEKVAEFIKVASDPCDPKFSEVLPLPSSNLNHPIRSDERVGVLLTNE